VRSKPKKVLNLYEAFGTTVKKTCSGSDLRPLLVVEVMENKLIKRYMVPHCDYACQYLHDSTVVGACPYARILTHEMIFPYDVIQEKTDRNNS
ncbi:hypothetical protein NPIL_23411, partial [Nephila pilipes]